MNINTSYDFAFPVTIKNEKKKICTFIASESQMYEITSNIKYKMASVK
jgi:hypothetical protein